MILSLGIFLRQHRSKRKRQTVTQEATPQHSHTLLSTPSRPVRGWTKRQVPTRLCRVWYMPRGSLLASCCSSCDVAASRVHDCGLGL